MLVDLNQACFITNWFSVHYLCFKNRQILFANIIISDYQ
nr:MAG TPA: hypothetical protein [Bacteriophage sp.]